MPWKVLRPVLVWLLVSVALTVLLAGVSLGFQGLLQPLLDIQMHNTYFVVQPLFLVGVLFTRFLLGWLSYAAGQPVSPPNLSVGCRR